MNKMRNLLWALALVPCTLYAQGDDLGCQLGVELDKKLARHLRLEIAEEVRTRDDMSAIDRFSTDIGLRWELLPWLHLNGGYVFLVDHRKHISHYKEGDREVLKGMAEVGDRKNLREFWGVRNRAYASFTVSKQWGDFKLSLRERWQYSYQVERIAEERYNYVYKKSDKVPHLYHGKAQHYLRSRLTITYKPQEVPVKPYACVETYNAWDLERVRYTVGAEWKINKRNTLDAFYRYRYESDHDDDDPCCHIIGLAFILKI